MRVVRQVAAALLASVVSAMLIALVWTLAHLVDPALRPDAGWPLIAATAVLLGLTALSVGAGLAAALRLVGGSRPFPTFGFLVLLPTLMAAAYGTYGYWTSEEYRGIPAFVAAIVWCAVAGGAGVAAGIVRFRQRRRSRGHNERQMSL